MTTFAKSTLGYLLVLNLCATITSGAPAGPQPGVPHQAHGGDPSVGTTGGHPAPPQKAGSSSHPAHSGEPPATGEHPAPAPPAGNNPHPAHDNGSPTISSHPAKPEQAGASQTKAGLSSSAGGGNVATIKAKFENLAKKATPHVVAGAGAAATIAGSATGALVKHGLQTGLKDAGGAASAILQPASTVLTGLGAAGAAANYNQLGHITENSNRLAARQRRQDSRQVKRKAKEEKIKDQPARKKLASESQQQRQADKESARKKNQETFLKRTPAENKGKIDPQTEHKHLKTREDINRAFRHRQRRAQAMNRKSIGILKSQLKDKRALQRAEARRGGDASETSSSATTSSASSHDSAHSWHSEGVAIDMIDGPGSSRNERLSKLHTHRESLGAAHLHPEVAEQHQNRRDIRQLRQELNITRLHNKLGYEPSEIQNPSKPVPDLGKLHEFQKENPLVPKQMTFPPPPGPPQPRPPRQPVEAHAGTATGGAGNASDVSAPSSSRHPHGNVEGTTAGSPQQSTVGKVTSRLKDLTMMGRNTGPKEKGSGESEGQGTAGKTASTSGSRTTDPLLGSRSKPKVLESSDEAQMWRDRQGAPGSGTSRDLEMGFKPGPGNSGADPGGLPRRGSS